MDKDPKQELRSLSPLLGDLREKGSGFEAPPGFFDRLQDEVMEKIKAGDQPAAVGGGPVPGRLRVLPGGRTWWAAAAAVAVLLVAGWWFSRESGPEAGDMLAIDMISTEEATAYLDATLEDYDLALLVEELGELEPELEALPELDPQLEDFLEDLELEDLEDIL